MVVGLSGEWNRGNYRLLLPATTRWQAKSEQGRGCGGKDLLVQVNNPTSRTTLQTHNVG